MYILHIQGCLCTYMCVYVNTHITKNYTKILIEIVSMWWDYGSLLSFKFIFNNKCVLLMQKNRYLKLHHLFAVVLIFKSVPTGL